MLKNFEKKFEEDLLEIMKDLFPDKELRDIFLSLLENCKITANLKLEIELDFAIDITNPNSFFRYGIREIVNILKNRKEKEIIQLIEEAYTNDQT